MTMIVSFAALLMAQAAPESNPNPPPGIAAPPSFEVFAVLDRTHPGYRTAELFAPQLTPGAGFNASLHAQLGNPKDARPYFVESRLPEHFEILPFSSRYQSETMLRLTYPGNVANEQALEALRRSGRFKAVSLVSNERLAMSANTHIPLSPLINLNDPLYSEPAVTGANPRPAGNYPWLRMKFPQAWALTKGRSLVGALDAGLYAQVDFNPPHNEFVHEDLADKFAQHLSQNTALLVNAHTADQYIVYVTEEVGPAGAFGQSTPRGHGTHVAALLAGTSENAIGNVGSCPSCVLAIARDPFPSVEFNFDTSRRIAIGTGDSARSLIDNGIVVLNRSGANPNSSPTVDCSVQTNSVQETCISFLRAYNRDVALVVSAGNFKEPKLPFPNNIRFISATGVSEAAVISVGGHRSETTGPLPWQSPASCSNQEGCGTNFGWAYDVNNVVTNQLSVLAASPSVLTAFYPNATWAPTVCLDSTGQPMAPNGTGYDYCTGTSMSAPLVSGLIGLLRSVNPLIDKQHVRELIEWTASRSQTTSTNAGDVGWTSTEGFGIPDAELATKVVLGRWMENGNPKQWTNRLTPLFHLHSPVNTSASQSISCAAVPTGAPVAVPRPRANSPGTGAHLQTSNPQVAASALENSLYLGHGRNSTPAFLLPVGPLSPSAITSPLPRSFSLLRPMA
jgi:subtilisin family serine protease